MCGVLCLVFFCTTQAQSEEAAPTVEQLLADVTPEYSPPVELLWKIGTPGAKGDEEGDKPSLTIYLPPPEKATGVAIVICPGGAYSGIAMEHEGHAVAKWLNSIGVAGFIVKYRHAGHGYRHPAPLMDAQRAMRMVRARAEEWNINPGRIGIMGFSAGGHLASTVGTHFDMGKRNAQDPIDQVGCRPDFMVLIYPVISFVESYTARHSRQNLLGKNPKEKVAKKLSNERHVSSQTPPAFLVHSCEDIGVPPENSLFFFLALRRAHIAAELHIFSRGPHGFGLGQKGEPVAEWPGLCEKWMKKIGFIESTTP